WYPTFIRVFFFQAEAGIRDFHVTGVQTCALPICAMSAGEMERLMRAYTLAMLDVFGPDKDIPAPDMGTGSREMAWLMDEYSKAKGMTVQSVVTGKPLVLGGSLGRAEATGRGVMVAALA